MLFRTKINIVLLGLSIIGSQLNAADAGYMAQAQQKARNARDWSVQMADKARVKANDAYVVTCEKARALYEKAKENKKFIAGALAYLAYEAVGSYNGWYTPLRRLFVLPGQLDAANANNENLTGQLNAINRLNLPQRLENATANNLNLTEQLDAANENNRTFNGHLNAARADLNMIQTVTLPVIRERFANLNGQLNTARVNLNTANNIINDRNADLKRLENRLMNVLDDNRQEQQQLIDQLNQARAQAQQVQQPQAQPGVAQAERQGELDRLAFGIVLKNFAEQSTERLNATQQELQRERDEAEQTQADLMNDLEANIQKQEVLIARVDRERSKAVQNKAAYIQEGRAQLALEQKYNAIVVVLNNVDNALQSAVQDGQYQAIDAVGIINDVMHQLPGLAECRTAYHDQTDKQSQVNDTFERAITLMQQTMNHVINQISDASEWLKNETVLMNFADVTEANFDQELELVYSHIHNNFDQISAACGQLNWIINLSNTNETIKFCLDRCDDVEAKTNAVVQSLGAMLTNSLAKVEQLLNNNNFVTSYDDAFNLYAHALVTDSAYEMYNNFCAMMPNSEGLQDWAKTYEAWIAFIKNTVLTGNIQLEDASFNGMNSTLGHSTLYNSIRNNSDLDRSVINDLGSINSLDQHSKLVASSLLRSGMDNSLSASMTGSVVDLDALLTLATAKGAKDWEDELDAINQSSYNFGNSSVNLNGSNLTLSKLMASSLTKSMNVTNSINVRDSINLSASVASFVGNASMNPCPFVPAEKWANAQAKLDQSGHFDNRKHYSMVSNFAPIYVNKPNTRSLLNNNNNISKPATRAVGNLISKFEIDGLVSPQKRPATKNTPKYTVTDLVNELGESITPQTNAANAAENSGTIDTLKALLTLDEPTTTATSTYHPIDYYSYTGDDDVDSGK